MTTHLEQWHGPQYALQCNPAESSVLIVKCVTGVRDQTFVFDMATPFTVYHSIHISLTGMGKMCTCGVRTCEPADWRTGKLLTKLADRVRILPTCVASCHSLLAQGRTSCLAGPRIHTFHGSPSLPPFTAFHPSFLSSQSACPSADRWSHSHAIEVTHIK